jgi:hypothetical protein
MKNRSFSSQPAVIAFILLPLMMNCQAKKPDTQVILKAVKAYYFKEISDIKTIDTIYILRSSLTLRSKDIMQSSEYLWAYTEASKAGNGDSTYFKRVSDEMIDASDQLDNKKLLYHRILPMVIYTTKNNERKMGESSLYFNKELQLVDRYSIIEKICKVPTDVIIISPYTPFPPNIYEMINKGEIGKYYDK